MKRHVVNELKRIGRSIEPLKRRREFASQQQQALRESLNTGRFGARVLRSYLSGSYARNTAIRPMDDVDVVFVINPNAWKVPFFRRLPRPDMLLDSFARAVRSRRPAGSSVRQQRRSVRLIMDDLDFDIVPAVVEDDDDPEILLIPDRDDGRWIKSAPSLHAERATEANRRCNRLAKPIIKLLKYWNTHLPSTTSTKSFVIETIAIHLLLNEHVSELVEGLENFWDFLALLGGGSSLYEWATNFGVRSSWTGHLTVRDTSGLGGNVAASVTEKQLKRLAWRARLARDHLRTATRARSTTSANRHLDLIFPRV